MQGVSSCHTAKLIWNELRHFTMAPKGVRYFQWFGSELCCGMGVCSGGWVRAMLGHGVLLKFEVCQKVQPAGCLSYR